MPLRQKELQQLGLWAVALRQNQTRLKDAMMVRSKLNPPIQKMICFAICEWRKQCDDIIQAECSYKQLLFWLNHQHLHRQSKDSKLVSAMTNFHAKNLRTFGFINIISRHSSS